ncbi:MAG TPA: hypothetical protein VHG71_06580 [Verrucomicrobiae bacterium]|nr:hypothetical protein [Verrucomicrobiae bacterium]
MNPEKHLLETVEWQFFCTFTFRTLKVTEAVWLKMYFAMMREQADNFGVHFLKILWVLRKEKGELTHRPHFHALIAAFPASAVSEATCFSFMKIWERFGGGQARVRVYDSTLTGVEYVLKGVDASYTNAGANWYELGKFGTRCDVMLSMSLIRHMENRSRFGHRDRDGLFSGINGELTPNKRLTGYKRVEEDRHAGNTRQGEVRRSPFEQSMLRR